MSLNLLSGLLLAAVTLGIVAYAAKQIVSERSGGMLGPTGALGRRIGREAKPVNDHLIGAIGKVIDEPGGDSAPIRVRVSGEIWPARVASDAPAPLAVGSSVQVTDVDGAALVVSVYDNTDRPESS